MTLKEKIIARRNAAIDEILKRWQDRYDEARELGRERIDDISTRDMEAILDYVEFCRQELPVKKEALLRDRDKYLYRCLEAVNALKGVARTKKQDIEDVKS